MDQRLTSGAEGRLRIVALATGVGACIAVLLIYGQGAMSLLAYPWDWSPDEGLALDHARRLARVGLRGLYGASVVPFPDFYGPMLPFLLTVVGGDAPSLHAARWLAVSWTALITLAVALLAARGGSMLLGCLCGALVLAPFKLSFWLLLARNDGPALLFWLWAAVALLPPTLARGAAVLPPGRALLGTLLLLAGVLSRPTTIVVGAPLILGWWLVDRRSALRLTLMMAMQGLACLALLEWASAGGYLATMALWATHGRVPSQVAGILSATARRYMPVLLLAALGAALAVRAQRRAPRDGSLALLAGGALLIPLLAKGGATANSLLPLMVATAVFAGRAWSSAAREGGRWLLLHHIGPVAAAAAALALLAGPPFRVPSAADAATARRFYGFLAAAAQQSHAPLLALTPDYAYVVVGQPVEMHGSALPYLERSGAPGVALILDRLERAAYGAIVIDSQYWPDRAAWHAALNRSYKPAGRCWLGYYYGHLVPYYVMVRRESSLSLDRAPGVLCEPPEAVLGSRGP